MKLFKDGAARLNLNTIDNWTDPADSLAVEVEAHEFNAYLAIDKHFVKIFGAHDANLPVPGFVIETRFPRRTLYEVIEPVEGEISAYRENHPGNRYFMRVSRPMVLNEEVH